MDSKRIASICVSWFIRFDFHPLAAFLIKKYLRELPEPGHQCTRKGTEWYSHYIALNLKKFWNNYSWMYWRTEHLWFRLFEYTKNQYFVQVMISHSQNFAVIRFKNVYTIVHVFLKRIIAKFWPGIILVLHVFLGISL